MEAMMDYDKQYMAAAELTAANSKDRSTKTGCVIVSPDHIIRAVGYNSFPAGVHDLDDRHERPEKYFWTEHAERNAIYDAAKRGVSLDGCTAYINWYPCMDCGRALVQSGVTAIVCREVNMDHEKYAADFRRAATLFAEAGIEVRFVVGEADAA
jgi:dCMP deaminase